MPEPAIPLRHSRCAAYLCLERAQGRPDCGEEFCVGHLRVVQQFRRWLDCRSAFMAGSEIPVADPGHAVRVGPAGFDASRERWAVLAVERRREQLP